MQKINQKYINNLVFKALEEDLKPNGDITTKLLNSKNKIVQAKIISKQSGIISGINFCKAAFKLLERKSKFLQRINCLLYTSPSPRDAYVSRMPSAA